MDTPNYYAILGLRGYATPKEVREAFKKASMFIQLHLTRLEYKSNSYKAEKHHPEKNKGQERATAEKLREASEAYHTVR
jgi:DnaJ-class molecular chaperone